MTLMTRPSQMFKTVSSGNFEVINNAENANIAIGDQSKDISDFESIGDKIC
ncbi:uncharacterized protein RCO7_14214 [Rhynchosporium graminicola]|uniref:Uncharacterized protein n=1 Tax=Rhynchosporium graminicola TaxID=2792576 RepID=A0A1E1JZS7_9HELO|nr:uncharacterized protein RCO7_14214 [Rhynchosporium commune]